VHVVTPEEIRRTGVTSFAEALRLAPGVSVARARADQWSVGIRGFFVEVALVGQNLLDERHREFSGPAEIQRGAYGQVTLRW
jgi:iron complex outermembrane receptor protein